MRLFNGFTPDEQRALAIGDVLEEGGEVALIGEDLLVARFLIREEALGCQIRLLEEQTKRFVIRMMGL